jgi:hypothetical protein
MICSEDEKNTQCALCMQFAGASVILCYLYNVHFLNLNEYFAAVPKQSSLDLILLTEGLTLHHQTPTDGQKYLFPVKWALQGMQCILKSNQLVKTFII